MAQIQFSKSRKKLFQMCASPVRGMAAMALQRFISKTQEQQQHRRNHWNVHDEEGEIVTREVKGKFVNGKPEALEVFHLMRSQDEWDRFMRFMERYAQDHELGFSKS